MDLQQAHLTDDVIAVRPWSVADIGPLAQALQDREVSRWIPVIPFPYSERDAREYVERTSAPNEQPEAVGYAIEAQGGGALLGQVGLSAIDLRNRTAEIGYWIVREHRGHGVALRAVRLLSDWAFDEAGFERLELRTLDGNTASERVATKAGFVREGVLRSVEEVEGRRRDLTVWSLLRQERGKTALGARTELDPASAPLYCYSCGHVLEALPPTVCASCGVHHWNDAKPSGVALVENDGRLLLVRRAVEPWKGRWDFPGGFCDGAEHPISAAEREVFEETGIRVRVTGYLGAWHETHDDPDLPSGTAKTTLGFFYCAVPVSDVEPQRSAETTEARWFLLDDVPSDIAFPEQQLPAFDAWQQAVREGRTTTPLPDRPSS